jgi:hypothetical protein
MTQDAPTVPPVEAKATTETTTTKAANTTTSTPAQTPTTEQNHLAYALTLPEDALIEASAIERTAAFAKAHNLSPEAAQKALEHANGEVAAYREQQTEAWTKLTRETWVNDAKADPEFGGEKFDGSVTDAKRFLERHGDEEIRQFLDATGFGNHKLVIRMFARAERGQMNHRPVTGGPGGTVERKTAAQKTYPYMNP